MNKITTRLTAAATPTAPALVLRPWTEADAIHLVDLYQDAALRRWTSAGIDDLAGAEQWVLTQQRGWEAGDRRSFAVLESPDGRTEGRLVGHVVVKGVLPGSESAEVGYWTAAYARGHGVAPRALEATADWAFGTFADAGLLHLELLHQVDNTASCRVADKCRFPLASTLPAAPPDFPHDGHLHIRTHR
ncbi:GNAT family N-acetyltransferase [Kitasatospora paracochleata]|uniref:RimJ/RimL family protein N-acetyltransferase n=1 Tax=Kitasatospora paracochleata TaxID=58354 RepID=A0ABT1J2P5_9ACTN|nr:GNAT family N-acetyltransferase [Kitasatospora paracochleata]MCP2311710.1 RimJ/RimL family protein N-acetyltransferase [Kitasatospora paracochleata]